MLDRLFADIDRARAEAAADFAAGVPDVPLPGRSPKPAAHPLAAALGRLVLVVVLAAIVLQVVTGIELRPVLIVAFSLPLLARIAAHVGLLPADLYRPNGWGPVGMRAFLLAWYLAVTFYPILLAVSLPLLVALRWRSIHKLSLWAMKRQELRRLRAGKPPTAPIASMGR